MIRLQASRQSLRDGSFERALKRELENLPTGTLPLEQATSRGGRVDDHDISVTVISAKDTGEAIQARVGIFFTEIVGGCGCGDDPIPENTYCEMRVSIDKHSSAARFELIG